MKPELMTAAGSIAQMERYVAAGADAVLIGEPRYGARLPGAIPEDQLKEAVSRAHELGAKAYVAVNKLLRNHELSGLPGYLRAVREAGADAIVFGDPAVLLNVKEAAPGLPLHWNAEMTGTNSAAASYWARKGATRAVLARELNEEEIASFKASVQMEVQVQVHGMTNIYHSQRNLLQSYMEHLGREARLLDLGPAEGLFLVESERPDERLPVYEDENGTHVMSADDICLLEAIPELLSAGVDSLYVEPLLKSDAYNETALQGYRKAVDAWSADPSAYEFDEGALEAIRALQDPRRELSFGFLYKEQVY
ncbi:peptidase U32 family protein [Cohnella sp. REN36]|uniref:peptidase U32 family protein n=1 Tax=Cohnella sp. REN36 TaxID=2887347 RepID=UPI001D14C52A|nr:peptidase U32 family protein [Cohnella sp. REN36]MCC3375619.1 U32 family peptidase [Cohnella sp. REN36]